MTLFFDPIYVFYLLPGLALALWARARGASAFRAGSGVAAPSGLTGAEIAGRVLRAAGVEGVAVERVAGALADFYDPGRRVVRLSPPVHDGRTLAAAGVAAHEAGQAVAQARGAPWLAARTLAAFAAGIGSTVFWILLLAWPLLGLPEYFLAATAVLWANLAVQVACLPIEAVANRRAREALGAAGLTDPGTEALMSRVLDAAAWARVAAPLTATPALLYRWLSRRR